MEILTGIMIAILIFYSGKLIMNDQLSLNNFFFFSCNDVGLPTCESLAQINVGIGQGLSAAKRILPIIDTKNLIKPNDNNKNLNFILGTVDFKNKTCFSVNIDSKVLNDLNKD